VFGLPVSVLARRSEEETLKRLIGDHEPAIRRLAHSMLKDHRDVEEAVLDTFFKAHAARRRFRGQASERTWLHRICFNLCVDRLRSTRGDLVALAPDLDLPTGAAEPELRLVLWQEINHLPNHLQWAFKLKQAGYSVTEIAALARMPRTTVSGYYHAACRELEVRLTPLFDDTSRNTEGR
jgi:RNA polymerase sigma-70 factor (ECF subfamily)